MRYRPKVPGAVALLLSTVACAAASDPSSQESSGPTSSEGIGGTGAAPSGGSGSAVGGGGSFGVGAGTGGAVDPFAEVFGESAENLFRLDPKTKEVTVIGPFSPPGEGGCFPVIDIAVDKDSNLYVTTYEALFRVDKDTAACTLITTGAFPNSLSFVPAGTVDPAEEALVAYSGSSYVRIDTATGEITTIGDLGPYVSSGDIVSVKNGKTLVTVKGAECGIHDCLLEIDPTTGAMVKNWGALPYEDVFGLAFWAGTAYGFAQSGELFEISFGVDSVTTTPIPIPNPPEHLYFWGAGSTTSAPPVEVPD
jgi:hypothetical protein